MSFKCELNLKKDKKLLLFFFELDENISKLFAQKDISETESVIVHLWYFPIKMSGFENQSQASFLSMKCHIEKILQMLCSL